MRTKDELRAMTVRQLREYARRNQLGSLAGASTKEEIVREIVLLREHLVRLGVREEGDFE